MRKRYVVQLDGWDSMHSVQLCTSQSTRSFNAETWSAQFRS